MVSLEPVAVWHHPALDGRVVDRYTALLQECFHMPGAQGVGYVPVIRNDFIRASHCLLCTLILGSNAFRSFRHAVGCNGAARVSP